MSLFMVNEYREFNLLPVNAWLARCNSIGLGYEKLLSVQIPQKLAKTLCCCSSPKKTAGHFFARKLPPS
jgi:hypothetical protein